MLIRRFLNYYGIYRFTRGTPVHIIEDGFFSLTRTEDEVTIICRERQVEGCERADEGYALFRLEQARAEGEGEESFQILLKLAQSAVQVVPFSTYDSFFLLIKKEYTHKAAAVLQDIGHSVWPQ